MDDMVTRDEFNGIGQRIGKVELMVASMDSKVMRNEEDIQKMTVATDTIKTTINEGKIYVEKTLNRAKWQILVMVAIPIVLFILNLMAPKKTWTKEHTHFQSPPERSISPN